MNEFHCNIEVILGSNIKASRIQITFETILYFEDYNI